MKVSLIGLIACCAVSTSSFAFQCGAGADLAKSRLTDMPGNHPPQISLTDMPGNHPPQVSLTDMPGNHPPQIAATLRLAI